MIIGSVTSGLWWVAPAALGSIPINSGEARFNSDTAERYGGNLLLLTTNKG